MILKRVEITFTLPITCSNCGTVGKTSARKLKLQDVEACDIDWIVKQQRIGTSHPIGWASYYGNPDNVYRCPECNERHEK